MIQCPNCKSKHPINTLFCDECGEYLGTDKKETDALMSDVSKIALLSDERLEEFEWEGPAVPPAAVSLMVGQLEREFTVSLDKEVMLGRRDPGTNNYPEVDLTDFEGAEQGVSRRHARIICPEDQVLVEDLGSANGSYVNGKPLTPYMAYPLRNGDLLRLGKMKIKIVFRPHSVRI
jgi:hypothetical protein